MLNRPTRPRVVALTRLEQVENVLGAQSRPQRQEMMVGVGEGPTATNSRQARVLDLRKNHDELPIADPAEGGGEVGMARVDDTGSNAR